MAVKKTIHVSLSLIHRGMLLPLRSVLRLRTPPQNYSTAPGLSPVAAGTHDRNPVSPTLWHPPDSRQTTLL